MISELGQLLELLYDAHRGVDAMFLEARDWSLPDQNDAVSVVADSVGTVRIHWPAGAGLAATPVSFTRRVWFQPPDRIRVEVLRGDTVVRAGVRDGAGWWRWDQSEGESAGDVTRGNALPQLLELPLLRPARVIQTMWLEVAGVGTRAERDVVIATGTPRDAGATQHFDLEFDLENGTQLRTATFVGDECTGTTEVTSVNYSPTIHPHIFTFVALENYRPSPPGARAPGSAASQRRVDRPPLMSPRAPLTNRGTVWLTGLSGAGKTTIARATERLLNQLGIPCCVLDGDELRLGLSADLGLSREDRGEQARRVAHVAATLAGSGVIAIVALVSPYAEDRGRAREIHKSAGVEFVEVWVDTPLEVCSARDAKGLYAAAQAGIALSPQPATSDGSGLTGLTAPYEIPVNHELRLSGQDQHPRLAASQILETLFSSRAGALRSAIEN